MSDTDGRPSRASRVIIWSIGGVVAAGFLVAALGTRLTFFGEQPSPYDDHAAFLYVNAAIGSIAAAGLAVAWMRRSRSMAWSMLAMLAFAVVLAGLAMVEQRGRDRHIADLHDMALAAADDFGAPSGFTERERTELRASWDSNREYGNVRVSYVAPSVAPEPSAIVDVLTSDFCGSGSRPDVTPRSDTIEVAFAVVPELIAEVRIPSAERLRPSDGRAGADVTVTFRYHRAGEVADRSDLTC